MRQKKLFASLERVLMVNFLCYVCYISSLEFDIQLSCNTLFPCSGFPLGYFGKYPGHIHLLKEKKPLPKLQGISANDLVGPALAAVTATIFVNGRWVFRA